MAWVLSFFVLQVATGIVSNAANDRPGAVPDQQTVPVELRVFPQRSWDSTGPGPLMSPATIPQPPSDRAVVGACDFHSARIESMVLPVLPSDPLRSGERKEPIYDMLISRQGDLIASGAYYLPSAAFRAPMKAVVEKWSFSPAVECGDSAQGFLRHRVRNYFFVCDPPTDGRFVPAVSLWSVSRELMARLSILDYYDLQDVDIEIHLSVDANGGITRMRGMNEISSFLADHYFEQFMEQVGFDPARLDGTPVACELTLRLANSAISQERRGESEDVVVEVDLPERTMPRYPGHSDLEDEQEVAVALDLDDEGMVSGARVVGDVPDPFAFEVTKAVRGWQFDPRRWWETNRTRTTYLTFLFTPDSDEAVLLHEPEIVEFFPARATKRVTPHIPSDLLTGSSPIVRGNGVVVEVAFIVDEQGDVVDPEIFSSSHEGFSKLALETLSEWRFKPGRRGSEPVRTRMIIPFHFEAQ